MWQPVKQIENLPNSTLSSTQFIFNNDCSASRASIFEAQKSADYALDRDLTRLSVENDLLTRFKIEE